MLLLGRRPDCHRVSFFRLSWLEARNIKMKIRPIVKDAFRVSELVYQFERIDVEDGLLVTGDIEEVNEKYTDKYLIGEAENRLDIAMDEVNQEDEVWRKDAAQLRKFIKKWKSS